MALDPALATAIAGLRGELAAISGRLAQVEANQRTAQLGNSSVENGSLVFNDGAGNPQVVLGLQPDGTFAHASVTSQTPVAPDAPLTSPGVLGAMITWDGVMGDGSAPLADFAGVQVHVSAVSGFTPTAVTLMGGMGGPGTFGVGGLAAGTVYYACLVAYNVAGNTSPPGAQAAVTPQSVPANIPLGAISALQIQTGAITTAQIAANAGILGAQIASQTITGANIAANTITANALEAGIVIAGVIDGTEVNAPVINGGIINGVMVNATNIYGSVISATTFTGTDFFITTSGEFYYTGTPALGNLGASVTTGVTTDPVGNPTGAGFSSYGPGNQASLTAGALAFAATAGTTTFFGNANGTMAGTTATGYSGSMSLGGVDTAIWTVTAAGFTKMSKTWPVPAGDVDVDTAYRLTVGGAGVTGTTQETMIFRLAAFGATLAQFTVGAAEFPTSTPFEFTWMCIIACASATSAKALITGNMSVSGGTELTIGSTVNASGGFGQWSGSVVISNTVASSVEFQAKWQTGTFGATVASGLSIFERLGT
jgi:hypothetical protein